jgi:hypothetical protein
MHSGSSRTAVADKTKVIVSHKLLNSGWRQSLAGHLYVTHRHYLGCAEASPAFSGSLAAGRTSAQHKAFPAVWHLGQDEGETVHLSEKRGSAAPADQFPASKDRKTPKPYPPLIKIKQALPA